MDYYSMIFILGILFWVLCGLGMFSLIAWVYIQLTYMKWNKEDREKEIIAEKVREELDNINNSDYSEIEESED